nr:hypothetical protein [Tanacetum cinerariifolium]
MDLFRATFVKSLNKKSYCLVVTDDYSRFTWVFFLATKDETSPILKTFIIGIENQLSLKVKTIRSDNGTELKNNNLYQFCGMKGIKREFSIPRTPQKIGIAERKNRTLIEAARTILADSLLPIPFWTEAVNTACYFHNMVLVAKPQNKTPYELLLGRTPSICFMRPFGCPVTILNTLDPLGKFDEKVDEGFLVGYSVSSKAFRVFNSRTRIFQETLHINFLENKPNVAGSGPTWLFDIDTLTKTMNYQSVTASNQSNPSAGVQEQFDAEKAGEESKEPKFERRKHESAVHVSLSSSAQTKKHDDKTKREAKGKIPVVGQILTNSTNIFSAVGPSNTAVSPTHGKYSYVDTSQYPDDPNMPELEDITYSDGEEDVGAEADFTNLETTITVSHIPTTRVHKDHHVTQIIGDLSSATQTRSMIRVAKDQGGLSQINNDDFHTCMFACFLSQEEPKRVHQALKDLSWIEAMHEENKKDEKGIVVRNKARLVTQGYTQDEGIDYEEVFAPVSIIEAILLFLAYASFMEFMVYQMDVKSAFLYGTIVEEVYVCQPPGFEDPDDPDKVYKVVKALYGLHQAPRAWQQSDILLVQIYVDDLIFGSTNKDLCKAFEKLMKDKFQMSSMGELTFFLGLQVKQKPNGIFISQDKYVAQILRKFGLTDGKSASTTIDTKKTLLKDPDGEDVDVHTYRSMIGSLMNLTSSRPDIMFAYPKDSPFNLVAYSDSDYDGASLDRKSTTGGCQFHGCRLISWQCKKQTVIATSSIEAELTMQVAKSSMKSLKRNSHVTIILSAGYITTPQMVLNSPCLNHIKNWLVQIKRSLSWLVQKQTALDASEGFDQIIDFLNASSIKYALTVNPNIYVSCIKQFWSSILVKKVNDVTRLQALVDKKKVIITEAIIRDALRLDDVESIDCLPNEEIFTELSRMGYEKPSTKLTFYKAFLSSQWKFLIHTILQCMSAKRASWNEFSSSMALAVICLSTSRKFNFSKHILDSLVRNVDSSTKFYMYLRFLQLLIIAQVGDISSHSTKYSSPALTQKMFANMRRVGKGFSGVDTPLFKGMIMAQQDDDIADEGAASVDVDDVPVAADEPTIPSPTPTTEPPPPSQDLPSTSQVQPTPPLSPIAQSPSPQQQSQPSQDAEISMDLFHTLLETWEIIASMDADEDVTLKDVADIAKEVAVDAEIEESDDELEPTKLQEVVEVVSTAKLMTEVVTAASATITAVDTLLPAATITAAASTLTTAPSATIIHTEPKSKDKGKGILDDVIDQVYRKEKEDNVVMRYQALKRKPQTEAQARKNMMIYMRNMNGFKMDYFKGMKYDDIRPIFEKYFNSNVAFLEKNKDQMEEEDGRALKRASESQAEKAAKRQKLDEEVPIVDYEIYTENNKPYYKIIQADGSPHLFLSFLTLLKNFDREDLEVLWQLVKERFASSKPKNFSDDFLLTTLTYMFEKPDVQAQMILLVERRYPLTRFTLDQMLNNVRLEVEEESEVSLELLRFVRQQQEGFRPE